MKKLYHLYFLLASLTLFAQYEPMAGNLNIFSENQDRFFIYLNGELQNNEPQTNIRIEDLNQRYYNVKVVFENKNLKEIIRNYVSVTGRDGLTFEEATYKIAVNQKTRKTKMSYFSGTRIIAEYIPGNDVYVINSQRPSNQNSNNGINININTNVNSPNSTTKPRNHWESPDRNPRAMDSRDFEKVRLYIKQEDFDDKKIALSQNLLLNNYLDTKQIIAIAPLFVYSKNQMEFVKSAYKNCIDVKNYYLIKNTFTFESDKNEFMKFINNQ